MPVSSVLSISRSVLGGFSPTAILLNGDPAFTAAAVSVSTGTLLPSSISISVNTGLTYTPPEELVDYVVDGLDYIVDGSDSVVEEL